MIIKKLEECVIYACVVSQSGANTEKLEGTGTI